MKKLMVILPLLLLGCEDHVGPSIDYFPPFNLTGDWEVRYYESGWVMDLELVHEGRSILGTIWPEPGYNYTVSVTGGSTEGSRHFFLEATDNVFIRHFSCVAYPGGGRFDGRMDVYTHATYVLLSEEFFYAIKKDST